MGRHASSVSHTRVRHARRARHHLRGRYARELAFLGYDRSGMPRLRSRAAFVYDPDSDQVLFSKNQDAPLPIASLTKIMTALVLLDADPRWDSVQTVTREDVRAASHTRIRVGERIYQRDLFQLSLMVSDNAATRALVRSTGMPHDRFVRMMNLKAQSMGLSGTRFVEETGLAPENVSSATTRASSQRRPRTRSSRR